MFTGFYNVFIIKTRTTIDCPCIKHVATLGNNISRSCALGDVWQPTSVGAKTLFCDVTGHTSLPSQTPPNIYIYIHTFLK